MRSTFWDDVRTWPSLSDAAAMLGLHKTTISRHARRGKIAARSMGLGRGRRAVPPVEVLRLGQIYRRIPMADLEHHLAIFVAGRAHADATAIERDLTTAVARLTSVEADLPGDQTSPTVPPWMVEFHRLLDHPILRADTAAFTATDTTDDSVYAGPYRDADDATLSELTGLDPAVFGR